MERRVDSQFVSGSLIFKLPRNQNLFRQPFFRGFSMDEFIDLLMEEKDDHYHRQHRDTI
jgi:hypothetical protein